MNVVFHLSWLTWVIDLDLAYLRSIAWFSLLMTICALSVIRLVSNVLLISHNHQKYGIWKVHGHKIPLSPVSHIMKTSTSTFG